MHAPPPPIGENHGVPAENLALTQRPTPALFPPQTYVFRNDHPYQRGRLIPDIVKLRLQFPRQIDVFGGHAGREKARIDDCGLAKHPDYAGNAHDSAPNTLRPAHESDDGTEFDCLEPAE